MEELSEDRFDKFLCLKIELSDEVSDKFSEFMLWCLEEQKRIQMENQDLHNSEISKKLGEMWNHVPEETKK